MIFLRGRGTFGCCFQRYWREMIFFGEWERGFHGRFPGVFLSLRGKETVEGKPGSGYNFGRESLLERKEKLRRLLWGHPDNPWAWYVPVSQYTILFSTDLGVWFWLFAMDVKGHGIVLIEYVWAGRYSHFMVTASLVFYMVWDSWKSRNKLTPCKERDSEEGPLTCLKDGKVKQ